MKTAVEFLVEQITNSTMPVRKAIEQAKEMEKQQIVDAWFGGYLNGEIKSKLKSEQYYNETYKNTKQ